MAERKAPTPPPGDPGYKGPPQRRPDPPPPPPPKRAEVPDEADRLEPTSPVAVLYPLKGEPWTMVIPSVLPEILVARRVPFSAHIEDSPSFETNHRRFRLSPHRSRTYRWWEIYNDGRSATPQDGFVYFEVPDHD